MVDAGDWNHPAWPKLWLYNLHYFDDLAASDASQRRDWHRALMRRWQAENPPHAGNGWEPYPTSLRIVNWIQWALAGNALDGILLDSLAAQCDCLRQRLEIHLLGNHLWANAKALVFAGSFFQGTQADAWRECGLRLLRREIAEQILPDGGHFERSPMYHAIVLADLLDLVQLAGTFPGVFGDGDVQQWRATALRMLRWLQVMSHPDGEIAFFNDAAFSVAPNLAALVGHAQTLGVAIPETALAVLEVLPDSGYVRLQSGDAVVIADVGEIGPSYLPGHAHADTLSFEFSLRGKRVLVNGGTSTYEVGAERLRQRGTPAHNAVAVNGEDSSEVWSSFRVARRAHPHRVGFGENAQGLWLDASHDGYRRLPGIGDVRRVWRLGIGRLEVEDSVEGNDGRLGNSRVYFHLHPAWKPFVQGDGLGEMASEDDRVHWQVQTGSNAGWHEGTWHPCFGKSEANDYLRVDLVAGRSSVAFRWQ